MNKLARTLILPLALTTALVACDKGSKSGGGGGGGATGAAGASAIAPKGGLRSALAAMPKETELVVGLDFNQLRKSALWKKYEPMFMEKAGKQLAEIKDKCGFDPSEKLSGVLFGAEMGMGDLGNATFFVKGFEKSAVTACIQKVAAEKAAEGKSANIDGDYIEMIDDGEVKMRGLFVDDTTLLMIKQGDGMADKAALQAAAAAKDGDGLTSSAGFVKLLDEVKTGSALFMVMNGNAKVMQQTPLPFKIKAIMASVNVGAGIEGESRVRLESADDASAVMGLYKMGVAEAKKQPMGKMLDNVKVSAKGADVVATFKFDQKQIEEMVEMAQSF
jgi:hypothetical protein